MSMVGQSAVFSRIPVLIVVLGDDHHPRIVTACADEAGGTGDELSLVVGTVSAYDHAAVWVGLGDDPIRYLVVGPDRSGNLLELIVIHTAELVELVIHAMALWRSTERELFGWESR